MAQTQTETTALEKPSEIIIKLDGSVNPPSTLIIRNGKTYTITDDIVDCRITVLCNDAIIDGAGHELKTDKARPYTGIDLNCTSRVTVKNFRITGLSGGIGIRHQNWAIPFYWDEPIPPDPYPISTSNTIVNCTITNNRRTGIEIDSSSYNTIMDNHITSNEFGVRLIYGGADSHNQIINNIIKNNGKGIVIEYCDANTILGNTISENTFSGIELSSSSNNLVNKNSLTKNDLGIKVLGVAGDVGSGSNNVISYNQIAEHKGWALQLNGSQTNNEIYCNNFIDDNLAKGFQVSIPLYMYVDDGSHSTKLIPGLHSFWDKNSQGNYWSDYRSRYANATEVDGAGLWNTAFFINENNIDHYPLIQPVQIVLNPSMSDSNLINIILIAGVLGAIMACVTIYYIIQKRKRKPLNSMP